VRASRLREALLAGLKDWSRITRDEGEQQHAHPAYPLPRGELVLHLLRGYNGEGSRQEKSFPRA
jgi:hypothetical protein